MNKGLKNYNKFITREVGNAGKVIVNVSKADNNVNLVLPLLQTRGNAPIDLSLIFNQKDKSEFNMFGNGVKLNLYTKLDVSGSLITVHNADGSIDNYSCGVKNKETGLTVDKIIESSYYNLYHYEIFDKEGNKKIYSGSSEYPESITINTTNKYKLDFISSTKTIKNEFGDEVSFIKTEDKVTRVSYKYNNQELIYITLKYSGDDLIGLSYFENGFNVANTDIIYETNTITLKDVILKEAVKCSFEGDLVKEISSIYDETIIPEHELIYSDYSTKIIDKKFNLHSLVGFDNQGMLSYELDELGNVKYYEFNETTKLPKTDSKVVNLNDFDNNILGSTDISKFVNKGLSLSKTTINKELIGNFTPNSYKVIGTGGLTKSIIKNIIDTDCFTVVALVKLNKGKASIGVNGYDTDLKISNEYQFIEVDYNSSQCRSSFDLSFDLKDAELEVGLVMLFEKSMGTFYTYDTNENVTNIGTGKTSSTIKYNYENKPNDTLDNSSTHHEIEYNSDDNVKKITSAYGVQIENVYDDNQRDNLTKSTVQNKENTRILELERQYTSDGKFVSKIVDELGNITSYDYDGALGKILKVTNALGHITNIQYYDDATIKQITQDNLSANYTYDDKKRVKTVTLANGSIYEFFYDTKSNITDIKLNNVLLFKYEYDLKTNNLIKQIYGNDYYEFIYDTKGYIKEIHFVKQGSIITKFTYQYDNTMRVSKILDTDGKIIQEYIYGTDGKVEKVKSGDYCLKGVYDNLDNLTSETRKAGSKTIVEAYSPLTRSKGSTPEALEAAMLGYRDMEYVKFSYGDVLDKYDGIIPYIQNTSDKPIRYKLQSKLRYPDDCGFLSFWFKPTNIDSKQVVFCCKKDTGNDYVEVYLQYGKLHLEVIDDRGEKVSMITTSTKCNLNKWNYFALSFIHRYDGYGYPDVCEYLLMLNGEMKIFKQEDPRVYTSTGLYPLYNIGCHFDNQKIYLQAKITGILISKHEYVYSESVRCFYRMGKDYLVENIIPSEENVPLVDFSQSTSLNLSNSLEVYPLQNTITSINGKRPILYNTRCVSSIDKDRTFNFNNKSLRYAYVADGEDLQYEFSPYSSFTIMMRAFVDTNAEKQTFFDATKGSSSGISLYRNIDNKLCFILSGINYITDITFTNDNWHNIAFSYKEISRTGSIPTLEGVVRIYMDGQYETKTASLSSSISIDRVMIGKMLEGINMRSNLYSSYEYYPLYGQIEMLSFSESFFEETTITSIFKELSGTSKIDFYDDFGMLKKKVILNGNSEILTHTYKYKTRSNSKYASKQIAKEVIKTRNNTYTERIYETDKVGNITKITDSQFGSEIYQYDSNGFVTKVGSDTIDYDNNGNILKYKTNTYTYDNLIKDRLIKFNNDTITYDTNNPLNPISYKGNTFEYEGRRLVKYNNVTYKYDIDGKRISKNNNGNVTRYYYSGNKLVVEVGNVTLDYLYDENNLLIGLIYNNNKYFYIRDAFQNILGLVDINGNVVVKYKYDLFGNLINISGSEASTIGKYNHFRFKGYYFDEESNMYYCKSRYYVPEWGRWLNADSPSFLDTTSVTKLNLFAYCENNQVMNVDYNGNFGFSAMLIGALVGAVSNVIGQLISDTLTNLADDDNDFQFSSWQSYVGSAVGGAIGGAMLLTKIPGADAVSSFASTSISMGLENLTGDANHTTCEILTASSISSVIGEVSGTAMNKIKINGINKGRGSLMHVTNTITTKLNNGTIKKISIKSSGKLVGMSLYNSGISITLLGFLGLF